MASGVASFPAVDAEKELNPQTNKEFQVDSVSSQVASSLEKEVNHFYFFFKKKLIEILKSFRLKSAKRRNFINFQ